MPALEVHHDLFGQPVQWAGVDRGTLLTKLNTLGWISDRHLVATTDEEVRRAIMAYQSFHQLQRRDGTLDAETVRSINATRYCSLPDLMPAVAGNLGRWGKKSLAWCMQVPNWPKIGTQAALNAYAQAFQLWADVADIHPTYTTNPSQADIVVTVGAIDGPYNVLAYSALPGPGNMAQLSQEFDSAESWTVASPPPQNQIDAVRVMAHELGHILGLAHLPGNNLMAPVYSLAISKPQNQDLVEIRARYGPSQSTSAPPPTPTPPTTNPPNPSQGAVVVGIEVAGTVSRVSIPGWTATRNA